MSPCHAGGILPSGHALCDANGSVPPGALGSRAGSGEAVDDRSRASPTRRPCRDRAAGDASARLDRTCRRRSLRQVAEIPGPADDPTRPSATCATCPGPRSTTTTRATSISSRSRSRQPATAAASRSWSPSPTSTRWCSRARPSTGTPREHRHGLHAGRHLPDAAGAPLDRSDLAGRRAGPAGRRHRDGGGQARARSAPRTSTGRASTTTRSSAYRGRGGLAGRCRRRCRAALARVPGLDAQIRLQDEVAQRLNAPPAPARRPRHSDRRGTAGGGGRRGGGAGAGDEESRRGS